MLDGRIRLVIGGLLMVIFALVAGMVMMGKTTAPALAPGEIAGLNTQAVSTFQAQLTASAPAATVRATIQPSATTTPNAAVSGTPSCLGLRFVRDVTIPDNTEMAPAQVFTKTWQVENNGTCAWKPGFQVTLIGGLAMGGSPFKVAQAVGPGGSIQISIKMVAPTNQTGVVQGTWMMADENGTRFGDYMSVVIVVTGRGPTAQPATITPAN